LKTRIFGSLLLINQYVIVARPQTTMPKKGGMRTYKEMKDDPELSNIPVIIITGISKEVDFKSLLDRSSTNKTPPDGHLVKPLTANDLIREIREVLD